MSMLALAALCMALVSCHKGGTGAVENMVREAFLSGDTTQARYDSIVSMIEASPERFASLTTDAGTVDVVALSELVDRVGAELRPPMHWNVAQYGAAQLSLVVYLERSGSMVPYDVAGGRGQLKKAVNDVINHFPGDKVTINIVNDNVYPYGGTVDQFVQDRDIYASTAGIGNASFTDFRQIFNNVLQEQDANNVSVVVTDLIYSPADTRDVSIDKILNEENSLATSIFKNYRGKSVVVHKFMGDYHGNYYPYNNQAVRYDGERPFYMLVIASTRVMDIMAADKTYSELLHPAGAVASYRFNQGESAISYAVAPDWKDNAGRFRVSRDADVTLTHCQGDASTGKMRFTVAADLSPLGKEEQYLDNATNYQVTSLSGFTLEVQRVDQSMITGNNRDWLAGKTHLLTLTGKLTEPRDEVVIALRNDFPQWVSASTATSDTDVTAANFATTTLGLEQWLRGMQAAFSQSSNYATMTIKLQR